MSTRQSYIAVHVFISSARTSTGRLKSGEEMSSEDRTLILQDDFDVGSE